MAADAEMDDQMALLEDLKDKMSYELQKAMALEPYESTDLYAFAKKCQFIDQTLVMWKVDQDSAVAVAELLQPVELLCLRLLGQRPQLL